MISSWTDSTFFKLSMRMLFINNEFQKITRKIRNSLCETLQHPSIIKNIKTQHSYQSEHAFFLLQNIPK